MSEDGNYWYTKGYNPIAVIATVIGAVLAVIPVLTGSFMYGMHTAAQYSWFIGCGVSYLIYLALATRGSTKMPELRKPVPQPVA